jgi:type IV fimbrial biogenesis protein FimT
MRQLGEGMQGTNRFTAVYLIAALVAATRVSARRSFAEPCRSAQQGFTLVELMITVAIVAILATLAAPSMTALINSNRLRAAANETIAVFQSARFEAIRANRLTVACMSPNPNAAVPACGAPGASGWIVFQDSDRNGQYSAAERLTRRATVARGVKLLGSATFRNGITFNADGMARDVGGNLLTAVVAVCLPTTKPQENESDVSISSGSRIRVTRKNAAGACLTPGDNP